MKYLEVLRRSNLRANPERFLPLYITGSDAITNQIGMVPKDFLEERLVKYPEVFTVDETSVEVNRTLTSFKDRTEAVDHVMRSLNADGHIHGWREEPYPVMKEWGDDPYFLIERAACPYLGIRCYGTHVNGYVQDSDGVHGLHMWLSRRSPTKPTYPNFLDNIAAGGLPYGISATDNVIKECWEEAGVPLDLASLALPKGAVSQVEEDNLGMHIETLFVYDLKLPVDFVPSPKDGEAISFERIRCLGELEDLLHTQSHTVKPNVCLVLLDFLVRHGVVTPESEPSYPKIISELHSLAKFPACGGGPAAGG